MRSIPLLSSGRRAGASPLRSIRVALLLLAAAGAAAAQEPGRYGHYDIHDPDLPPRAEYAARREAVLAKLDPSSAMLVRSAEPATRSNDVRYEYRQRNSMLYLSGVDETSSALLLAPGGVTIDGRKITQVLFVTERNPMNEVWMGVRMGPQVAASITGITTVLPYSRLGSVIDSLLPAIGTLYYDGWLHGFETEPLTGTTYVWDR